MMKAGYVWLGGMTVAALHAQVETDGKADRYHAMLLKKPESAVVFGRFLDAWLESGDTAGLKTFLEDKAKAGGAMDWRLLAVFRSHSGDEAGAVAALDEALKKEANDAGTRLARAKAMGAVLRFDDALADLEIAAKDAEQALEAGTLRGKFLARAGRPAEAVKAWKEVIAANPKDEGLVEDLIELEIGEGMMTEAVATARELAAKTQDPYKKALRRLRVAEILNQSGKREEALAEYREVFAVSAEDSWLEREVLGSVASIFGKEEDVGGLKAFYDGLREAHPRRVGVKKEAAKSLLASGQTDEAVEMFREVLKVLPGDRAVREEFASLLETAGRNEDAAAELQALVATAENDAALWERLAGLWRKLKNDAEMNKALDKIAALAAADESGRVSVAALYERFERREDAEKILREAVKTHGAAGEAGEALTAFLIKDKPDEAVAMWRGTAEKADAEGLLRISRSLSSNGKPDVAFEVLKAREAELKADPVFLMALCQAAQLADKSDETAPLALELVRMAKTTNDLESALKVASSILSRTKEPEQWRKTLAAKGDASVPELCLLAELMEGTGDSMGSAEVLKKAMAKDGGTLAASQRVRLHEMRGELTEAVATLREWMAMPGGAKAAQLKRLTDLLEKSGDSKAALAETENWKKIAPGDQQAWMKRVEIFSAEGQPEKAVAELRRAIAKFGGDEEMKGRLAEAQLAAGMTQEAWQLYLSLYNEAASTQSKMKWAVALAGVAKREGKEEELMAEFRKRARENATSTAPLLGLAELHREWGEGEQEIGIVREALRRKPDDIPLMLRLADLEENQGSAEKAGELLRAAMTLNPTPEAKRRLAIFLIRNGDTERGYAELIAGRVAGNPRDGEKLAVTMLDADQPEAALRVLDGDIAAHPDDWRLRHLRGIVLQRMGDEEKAFEEFAGQLEVSNELPGVKAALNAAYVNWARRQSERIEPANFYQLIKRSVTEANQRGMGIVQMTGRNSDIALPGIPEEARYMALARALAIADVLEDKEKWKARLVSGSIDGLDTILRMDPLTLDEVKEKLMSDKVVKGDYFWYTGMTAFGGNSGQPDQAFHQHLFKAFEKTEPELALGMLLSMASQAAYGRGEFSAENAVAMYSMIDALPQEKAVKQFSSLWMLAFSLENVPAEIRKKAEEKLIAVLGPADGGMDESLWLAASLPIQFMRNGRFEEAFVWLNKDRPESAKKRLKSMGAGYQSHGNSEMEIAKPQFPQVMSTMIDMTLWTTLEQQDRGGNNVRGQLLRMVGGRGGGRPGEKEIDVAALAPFVPKAKDPLVRMMMWTVCGKTDLLAAEVAELEKGPMTDGNIVRVLAAYYGESDPVKAYHLMVKARALSQAPELNQQIDAELAGLGVLVAGKEGVDLDPARRAALRLRKPMGMEDQTKALLANTMQTLGMAEESERYTAAPVRTSGPRSRMSVRSNLTSRSGGRGDDVSKLVADGKKDVAARRLLVQLAALGTRPDNRYQRDNLLDQAKSLKIETEVLAAAKPVAGASFERRKQYVQLLIRWKKNDEALPLLKSMTAERSQDFEVKSLLFGILPPAEQKEAIGGLAAADFDKMDEDHFAEWLDGIKDRESETDEFLNSIEAFTTFFEKLPPSGDATRNLSWINYHLVEMFRDAGRDGVKLKSLWTAADPKVTYDEDRSKRRFEAAKRLYTTMLKHPQTAEQGFMFLSGAAGSLGLTEAEIDKAALDSLRTSVLIETKADNRYAGIPQYRWMWRSSGGSGSIGSTPDRLGPAPDEYLAKRAMAGAKLELFPADLVKQVTEKNAKRGESLANAVKITGSSGTTALETWLKGAKRDTAAFPEDLVWLMKVSAYRGRRDLLGLLIEPAAQLMKDAQRMNSVPAVQQLVGSLGQAVESLPDVVTRMEAVEKITLQVLGPKESWKLFASLGDGMNNYTQGVSERIYVYAQLTQTFAMSPKARMAAMRFMAESGLQGMGRGMDDRLASSYNGDPEQFAREFLENGLFAPGPAVVLAGKDGTSLLSKAAKECEQRSNEKKSQSAAAMLLAVEGPDRFWARLMGARLSNDVAKAEAEIRAGSATVMKWTPEQKSAFALEMNQWFPGIGERLDGPMRGLFEKSEKTGDIEAKKLAETYLKDGFPKDMQFYSLDSEMSPLLGRLAPGEPELAAKLWMKIINHVRSSGRGGTSSYNGFQRDAAASAHCEIFEGLLAQPVPVPSLARLLADVEKQNPDVSFTASYNFDDLPEQAVQRDFERRKAQAAGEKAVAKLSPALRPYAGYLVALSRDTPKEARGTLIGLLASYGLTAKIPNGEVGNYITWVKDEFRKTDPDLADAMMFSLRYLRMTRESGYDMKLITESMLSYMSNTSVPLDFRLAAAARVFQNENLRKAVTAPELKQAISSALRQHVERTRQWANSEMVRLLNRALDADVITKEDALALAAMVKRKPPSFQHTSGGDGARQTDRMVFGLAMKGGDAAALNEAAKISADTLRGDLSLVVKCWRTGASEAAGMLLARPGGFHRDAYWMYRADDKSKQPVPAFSKEIEAALPGWLAGISDPGQRFRLECILSAARDAKDADAPTVPLRQRMAALIKRFPAEAPQPKASRMETLLALGEDRQAMKALVEDYRSVTQGVDYGAVLVSRDSSDGQYGDDESYLNEGLIRRGLWLEIDATGDGTLLLQHIRSLSSRWQGDTQYKVSGPLGSLGSWFTAFYLLKMAELPPERLKEEIPKAMEMATILLASEHRNANTAAVALAMGIRALSGDGAAFDKWFADLPGGSRGRYDEMRKYRLRWVFSFYKDEGLRAPEFAGRRKALLKALLNDKETVARELKHMTDLSSLMDSGAFSADEMIEGLGELAADHRRRAEFLCERAGITGWRKGDKETAFKMYDEAEAAANGDEKSIAFIRTYRSWYLKDKLGDRAGALAIAKEVKLDLLPESERTKTEKMIAELSAKK